MNRWDWRVQAVSQALLRCNMPCNFFLQRGLPPPPTPNHHRLANATSPYLQSERQQLPPSTSSQAHDVLLLRLARYYHLASPRSCPPALPNPPVKQHPLPIKSTTRRAQSTNPLVVPSTSFGPVSCIPSPTQFRSPVFFFPIQLSVFFFVLLRGTLY